MSSFPETSSAEDLVSDADKCLYKAKKAGKNRIIANIETSSQDS
jgi:PleD family two-component response regulator